MSAALRVRCGAPLVERRLLHSINLVSSCFYGRVLLDGGADPAAFRWIMGDLRPAILALNAVLIVSSAAAIACRVGRRLSLVASFSWHDGELLPLLEQGQLS